MLTDRDESIGHQANPSHPVINILNIGHQNDYSKDSCIDKVLGMLPPWVFRDYPKTYLFHRKTQKTALIRIFLIFPTKLTMGDLVVMTL